MQKFTKKVRWIIWFALVQAIVVYVVLVPLIGSEDRTSEEMEGNLPVILGVAGLVFFAIGQAIGYFVNHLKTPEGRPKAFPSIDVAFIAALALTEVPAIFGLLIGLSRGSADQYFLLYLLALIGMILLRPPAFYRVADAEAST